MVLGIVGAVIGGLITESPQGAQAGWPIGSAAGYLAEPVIGISNDNEGNDTNELAQSLHKE
jgi:hypothetical protein